MSVQIEMLLLQVLQRTGYVQAEVRLLVTKHSVKHMNSSSKVHEYITSPFNESIAHNNPTKIYVRDF